MSKGLNKYAKAVARHKTYLRMHGPNYAVSSKEYGGVCDRAAGYAIEYMLTKGSDVMRRVWTLLDPKHTMEGKYISKKDREHGFTKVSVFKRFETT